MYVYYNVINVAYVACSSACSWSIQIITVRCVPYTHNQHPFLLVAPMALPPSTVCVCVCCADMLCIYAYAELCNSVHKLHPTTYNMEHNNNSVEAENAPQCVFRSANNGFLPSYNYNLYNNNNDIRNCYHEWKICRGITTSTNYPGHFNSMPIQQNGTVQHIAGAVANSNIYFVESLLDECVLYV